MSSQPEESVYQSVYSIFVQSDDPNIQGCNVWFNQNHIPFNAVPSYRVAQSVSTMTPAPLPVDSPLSAAHFSFNSRASPQGNSQSPIFYSPLGLGTPTDPGLSAHRYSTMTSPEGAASLAPSPGPSTRPPTSPANPVGHNYRRHHNQGQESSGIQLNDLSLKCKWAECRRLDGFQSHESLVRHVREQHVKSGQYKCHECVKPFKRAHRWKDHMEKYHSNDKQ